MSDNDEQVKVLRKDGAEMWVHVYYTQEEDPDFQFEDTPREGRLKKVPKGWLPDEVCELMDGSFIEI